MFPDWVMLPPADTLSGPKIVIDGTTIAAFPKTTARLPRPAGTEGNDALAAKFRNTTSCTGPLKLTAPLSVFSWSNITLGPDMENVALLPTESGPVCVTEPPAEIFSVPATDVLPRTSPLTSVIFANPGV